MKSKVFNLIVPVHVAYGGLSFLISSLNNIFLLFYVSTYVYVFKIDSASFYVGETLFLIWNSVNDPLFGWISDKDVLSSDARKCNGMNDIVYKRICALSRYGPLFALSFLLFWFQVFPVGIQFSIALCLYDSFLTMVDLHHQALLADLAVKSKERVKLNFYCSIFSAAGTISVFVSFTLWSKHNLFLFRLFCITFAAFVFCGFYVCCNSMKQFCKENQFNEGSKRISENQSNVVVAKKYVKEVFQHRNFMIFSIMNLIQVFHCHFNSNFFPLFLSHLLGQTLTPESGAFLLGISFLLPHLNNLYFLQLCNKYGSYFIIQILFVIKLFLAAAMWKIGSDYWYLLCLFVASNRVFTEGTCKLLNLVITDLVDEDYVKFKRRSPVSALVFGTAAFLSKPGQTLAPLLGSYLFYLNTGQSIFLNDNESRSKVISNVDPDIMKKGCFRVLVTVPICCAFIQIIAWYFFTLKGKYLRKIKMERSSEFVAFSGTQTV